MMQVPFADFLLIVVVSLILGPPQLAAAVEPNTTPEPIKVVERFWEKIKAGDTQGAIALHTFSAKTKRHVDSLEAEYARWSTRMNKDESLSVVIGSLRVDGKAAVVMVTCDEGQPNPKPDPVYLVRQKTAWKMLFPLLPGDALAHGLDAETVASMKTLKAWAVAQRQK